MHEVAMANDLLARLQSLVTEFSYKYSSHVVSGALVQVRMQSLASGLSSPEHLGVYTSFVLAVMGAYVWLATHTSTHYAG